MPKVSGLDAGQVLERQRRGQTNRVDLSASRTYWDIIAGNVFHSVNVVLYVIGLGLVLVGDYRSAFATVVLVLFNASAGVVQEVRAKRQLEKIALLARAKVTVVRDAQEHEIDPSDVVLNDLLVIRSGDQIPVDGTVISGRGMQVDESALTGESEPVPKANSEQVLSGSFCVTGQALVEATGVGEQSFANRLTKGARKFKLELTPLQREVNRLLRAILLIVTFFTILSVLALFVLDLPVSLWLQIIAVITGSVSAGLLTLITLNYSWGAVRIGQHGGLVQQINAIESLSNVTVLCTDKTGTLTTNRILYHDAYPVGVEKADLEQRLGDFAANASSTNKTSEAIVDALPGVARIVSDEVPFSSARKWSAVAFDDPGTAERVPVKGAYVLGAMEMLEGAMTVDDGARRMAEAWSEQGLRVLAFARNRSVTHLHDPAGEPILPTLTLLGVLSFTDELRPHLRETIDAFVSSGIALKVISGDNPQTVAALARQAGLPGDLQAVSGAELAEMGPGEFAQTAASATVFGRVTPQQKEALVDALRDRGEYVAMIGDGVNDVLSLKKANMGVAMESGSTATRSAAAMLLLNDSFEALPQAFREGQRIANSIHSILKLFMATVFALLLLIVGISFLQLGFPFTTLQSTLLSFFARGIPPLILAVVAVAGRQHSNLGANILHFTLPASLSIFLFGLLIYTGTFFFVKRQVVEVVVAREMLVDFGRRAGVDYSGLDAQAFAALVTVSSAQTALTAFFVFSGVSLMVFAAPPTKWFAGGAPYNGRWLPTVSASLLIAGYVVVLLSPGIRSFFGLVPLPFSVYGTIALSTVLWFLIQRAAWRGLWLERFLDIPGRPQLEHDGE